MTKANRIDASELHSVRLSPDGLHLVLLLRDAEGCKLKLSLPTSCLNEMLTAVPQSLDAGTVHSLDTWRMALAENGRDIMLTMRTREGLAVSFTLKPWHLQGMATLAAYGGPRDADSRSVH